MNETIDRKYMSSERHVVGCCPETRFMRHQITFSDVIGCQAI